MNKFFNSLDFKWPKKPDFFLGMRAIKTATTVVLVLIFYSIIHRNTSNALLACVAGVVAMQGTLEHSISLGVIRVFATIIGAIVAVILGYIVGNIQIFALNIFAIDIKDVLLIAAVFVGCLVIIYICVWLDFKQGVVVSLVVMIVILLNMDKYPTISNAINRTVDTIIGIVISVIVNSTIKPQLGKEE